MIFICLTPVWWSMRDYRQYNYVVRAILMSIDEHIAHKWSCSDHKVLFMMAANMFILLVDSYYYICMDMLLPESLTNVGLLQHFSFLNKKVYACILIYLSIKCNVQFMSLIKSMSDTNCTLHLIVRSWNNKNAVNIE